MTGDSRWRGALETVTVISAFVCFGMASSVSFGWARNEPAAYHGRSMEAQSDEPGIWLLDGFNVLHAGLLGGRDRSEWWARARRDELLEIADRFDDRDAQIWVVFDGPRANDGVRSAGRRMHHLVPVFAPSADDWLLARVREEDDPTRVVVVTADRKVAGRARQRGARVVSPRDFLERCSG
jgi:predicted RNA-binding protein with PIN domain